MALLVEGFDRCSPLVVSVVFLSFIVVVTFSWNSSEFPVNGARGLLAALRFNHKGHAWLTEGYIKFTGRIFQVWSRHGMICVVPAKYLKELQKLPDSTLHFESVSAVTSPEFTGFVNSPLQIEFITHNLVRNLSSLRQTLFREAEFAVTQEIPYTKEWTSTKLSGKVQRIVACMNMRFISGPELNRDPEWLTTVVNYMIAVSVSDAYLKLFPMWLRPLVFKFMPVKKRLSQCYMRGQKQFEARHASQAKHDHNSDIGTEPFADWAAKRLPIDRPADLETKLQLSFGFAGVAAVTSALIHLIQDLAASPDLVKILREELSTVASSRSQFWENDGLAKLVKMDSFMKESQRIFPVSQVASIRVLQRDVTLDDGQILLRGQKCVAASSAISRDPSLYKNPEEFDPLRFYNLRFSGNTETAKYKFTALSHEMLPFGYGRHACPGRFLAHDAMKIILGLLLQKFDFRLPGVGAARPSPLRFGHAIIPDPWAAMEIRSRDS